MATDLKLSIRTTCMNAIPTSIGATSRLLIYTRFPQPVKHGWTDWNIASHAPMCLYMGEPYPALC